MKRADLLSGLLLTLISTTVALAILEGVVRLISPAYPGIYLPDSTYLHRLAPGGRKRFERRPGNGGGFVDIRIDSLGFRGPEVVAQRPKNVRRIVVFGDSFVEGEFSADSATFVRRLEHEARRAGGDSVEVINAGVAGYGPDQELLRMRHDLDLLKPDAVIIAIFADNDFGDLLRNRIFAVDSARAGAPAELLPNPHRLSDETTASLLQAAHPSFTQRLALARLWHRIAARLSSKSSPNKGKIQDSDLYSPANYIRLSLQLSGDEYEDAVVRKSPMVLDLFRDHYDADISITPEAASAQYKIRLMGAVLAGMQRETAARKIPALLLVIPSPIDICDRYDYTVDRTRYPGYDPRRLSETTASLATGAGFPVLNLWETYSAAGACSMYFRDGDNHWNERGQALAAATVWTEMRRRGQISWPL